MKFSVLALAGVIGSVTAVNQAIVVNSCTTPIYVQSFPYGGGAAGTLTTVQPGKKFTETLRATGSTVKIANTRTLTNPLFFGYSSTSNPDYEYYEFSNQFGNPFANKRNILSPGAGCQKFDCKPNQAGCYSTPTMKKVYGCPKPLDVTATICAPA